ncbi:MAG: ABC transporter substrate-binding protein [Oligoflexales bacterium]|nr:ABC transporter substrate-binding protein [Oligoflexales bacterium]
MLLVFFLRHTVALGWEGIAVHGTPKYKNGFTHLDYTDPKAPKGGSLVLGFTGSFDTLNPYSTKGISPLLLSNLVFQNLGQSTLDETFSQYPELAESFTLADDKMSMMIKLKKQAKFSDGKPVTAEDVKFSFDLFRSDHVNAFYKSYWADIKALEVVDSHTVKMIFARENTELPAIATQITILPKHIYSKGDFSKDYSDTALGSGPYVIKEFDRGSSVVYQRNQKFWGESDPFYQGRFNFDRVVVKYYKDPTTLVEAFKKGEFDLYICYSSKIWAKDLEGKKFDQLNWIKKELWQHENNQGSQGFYFNLRKPFFKDIAVRKAIALAFDFKWTNKALFYGQYKQNNSFFENSPLKATGLPEGKELEVLKELAKQHPDTMPDEVFSLGMGSLGQGLSIKKRLKLAIKLLSKAGYQLKNGVMEKDGKKLEFRFLLSSQMMARVVEPFLKNLKRIGIVGRMDVEESSVYQRRLQNREFDMIVLSIGQSQSPGNEQIDYWHSSEANRKYSRNHYGLENKVIDALINKIIYAKNEQELRLFTHALDRVLYHLHITVHNWHSTSHRIAVWNKFSHPEKFPRYYNPFTYIEYMWTDFPKLKGLEAARKAGKPLEIKK